jgi:hypothetical protein
MSDLTALDAKLYRGPAGSTAATLMENVRNCKLNRKWLYANTSRRGDRIKTGKATVMEAAIEYEMLVSDSDPDYLAIQAAMTAIPPTPLAFRCLDKVNGKGIEGDFFAEKLDRDEADEKEQTLAVGLYPTREAGRAPTPVV